MKLWLTAATVALGGAVAFGLQSRGSAAPRLWDARLLAAAEAPPAATQDAPRAAQAVDESEWGDLTVRFVYDGDPPEPQALTLNKDIEVCSKNPPRDESLLVHAENKGLANVVIWLDVPRGSATPPIHPSYQALLKEPVLLDNAACRFVPHVCLLRTGQTLTIGNSDPVAHSAALFLTRNDPVNVIVPPGDKAARKLTKSETLPSPVTCPIHSWMKGVLVVKDHPYMGVSDASGHLRIGKMPVGKWTVRAWHERPGYLQEVTRARKAETWEKGKLAITVRSGENDLGEVRVTPGALVERK